MSSQQTVTIAPFPGQAFTRSRTALGRWPARLVALSLLLGTIPSLSAQRGTAGSTKSPNYAAAFPFGGTVLTDLKFSEWFFGNHTVMLRFMPQYPTGYEGPMVTTDVLWGPTAGTYTIGQGDYRALGVKATKLVVRIGTSQQYYQPSTPLQPGRWYHLAVVRQGNVIRVYLDGERLGSPSFLFEQIVPITGLPTPGSPVILGRRLKGSNQQYYGFVDDVAVLNFAANQSFIQSIASTTLRLTGSESGLIAGYTFDDSTPSGGTLPSKLARWTSIQKPAYRALVSQTRNSVVDKPNLPRPVHATTFELPFDFGTHWKVGQNYGGLSSHNGYACFAIDLSCTNRQTYGQTIHASQSGRIVLAESGPNYPNGHKVWVEHIKNRESSSYLHLLGSSIMTAVTALGGGFQLSSGPFLWELSAPVSIGKGQELGEVGSHLNGDHFHWATFSPDMLFPIEFSQYEFYSGGAWVPVTKGMLRSGDIVRRRFKW